MSKTYKRKLSSSERLYIIYNDLNSPFANQMILEGSGYFDLDMWQNAVSEASAANPGSRVILKRSLGFSQLVDSGITPKVKKVDGSTWNGSSSVNAPFLLSDLSLKDGSGCEILLIEGNPLRIAFRTHHSVMDARGTMLWANDVFRALRNEPIIGSNSTLTEPELAKSFQTKGRKPLPHKFLAPTGKANDNKSGTIWSRLSLSGKYSNLIGQIAILIAKEAWSYSKGHVRIAVPVDMRPRKKNLLSTGNLTNLIYLDITPNSTPETISSNISKQLETHCDGMLYWMDELIRYMPLWWIKKIVKKEILIKNKTSMYRNSGIISNPGRVSLETFSGGGFNMNTFFFIPPAQEVLPFFIAMSGTKNGIELTLSMPKNLAGQDRLTKLIKSIENGLRISE